MDRWWARKGKRDVENRKRDSSSPTAALNPAVTALTLFLLQETLDCSLLVPACEKTEPELRPNEISTERDASRPEDSDLKLAPGVTTVPRTRQAMRANAGNGRRVGG